MTSTCPYCIAPVSEPEAHACAVCHAVHHYECWMENRGCAVALCAAGPPPSDLGPRPPVGDRGSLRVDLDEPAAGQHAARVRRGQGRVDGVSARPSPRRGFVTAAFLVAAGLLAIVVVLVMSVPGR